MVSSIWGIGAALVMIGASIFYFAIQFYHKHKLNKLRREYAAEKDTSKPTGNFKPVRNGTTNGTTSSTEYNAPGNAEFEGRELLPNDALIETGKVEQSNGLSVPEYPGDDKGNEKHKPRKRIRRKKVVENGTAEQSTPAN